MLCQDDECIIIVKERSETVLKSEQLSSEKRILNISFVSSFITLTLEILAVIFTSSQAVLIDCIYDSADLLMLLPFMLLVPRLYKPVTEKWPYGLSQIEPVFVIVRCMILLILDVVFLVDSAKLLISGGHMVDATKVASFEFGMALSCLLVFILLKWLSRKFISPTIESELYVWKADAFSTAGVGIAFVFQFIVQKTNIGWIAPYIDPGIAIILALILLPEPISMMKESLRSLILVSPDANMLADIRSSSEKFFNKYDIRIDFLDVVKTGRKIWVDIYIVQESDMMNLRILKTVQREIIEDLGEKYDDLIIEIIPELQNIKPL